MAAVLNMVFLALGFLIGVCWRRETIDYLQGRNEDLQALVNQFLPSINKYRVKISELEKDLERIREKHKAIDDVICEYYATTNEVS